MFPNTLCNLFPFVMKNKNQIYVDLSESVRALPGRFEYSKTEKLTNSTKPTKNII